MKKLNVSIIIPTRNRYNKLINTISYLSKNSFFFKELIIVDSSENKKEYKKYLESKFKNLNLKIFNSSPSISLQRNIGLRRVNKNSNYIMFLDDDIKFEKNSLRVMKNFLIKNKKYFGIGFNLITKDHHYFIEKIKKSKLFKFLGVYDSTKGKVTLSGWHTKAINLKNDTLVEWLSTQAVIYKYKIIKKKRFNVNYGIYSYLEDLDFSYEIKKKLIIHSKARYSSNNIVKRNKFKFGQKEIINRFIFVKKFKLSFTRFGIGSLLLILKNTLVVLIEIDNFFRVLGNFIGIFKLLIKNY